MGKAARKLNKALQKNKAADTAKEIQYYRERVSTLINEGKFSTAVDTLAEAATKKIKDVELMYDTAYCYFMVGDYERANRWINNVLTVSQGNKAARILLARLCLLQGREEDGLTVFDYVLENWRYQLAEAELQEIGETLEYYGREMPEKIRASYPHVAALLEENDALGAPQMEEPAGSSALEAVRDKLAALKKLTEKAEAKQETAKEEQAAEAEPFAATAVEVQPEQPAVTVTAQPDAAASVPSASDTLARLKDKLAALKAKTAAAQTEEKPEAVLEPIVEKEEMPTALESVTEVADELEPDELTRAEAVDAEEESAPSLAEMNAQAEAKRDEVMAMSLSLEEKIGALNNFAGAYFFAGAYHAAEVLLQAALKIDPKRTETIRNMAMLLKEMGDQEAALQCAGHLPMMDFALLALLREKE